MARVEDPYAEENSEASSSLEYFIRHMGSLAVEDEMSNGGHDLDVGVWSKLDDHLKEKIIARLPFKSFFRASSSLSKTWRLTVDSQWFKAELQNNSSSWESYCPVYAIYRVDRNDPTMMDLMGYESGSKRWHRLPSHSYRPQDLRGRWYLIAVAGSLFCWACEELEDNKVHVIVTNPLTRSWKQLPPREDMLRLPDFVHIELEGSKAYKVIVGTLWLHHRVPSISMNVQIFDSTDESWTTEAYTCTKTYVIDKFAAVGTIMNGIVYALVFSRFSIRFTVISLDVRKKIWSEIPLRLQAIDEDLQYRDQPLNLTSINFFKVFVCGSHVMMAMNYNGNISGVDRGNTGTLSLFQLDAERGLACEVSRAPNNLLGIICLGFQNYVIASAHGDCIYISHNSYNLLVYNVRTRQWHTFRSIPQRFVPYVSLASTGYQPGLNPFLEV